MGLKQSRDMTVANTQASANGLQVFEFRDYSVRTVLRDGQPWWVAKDVCEVLDLENVSQALSRLDDDEKGITLNDTLGGVQKTSIVNESGLYTLVLSSRKPEAKAFKKWITSEVLPQIRKTGSYGLPQTYAEALRLAANQAEQLEQQTKQIEAQDQQIQTMKPGFEFYVDVVDSKDTIDMAQVAKTLNMGIGRNQLFAFLRSERVLRHNNEPMQRYVDTGWFRTVEYKWTHSNGDTRIGIKTVVFQKGLDGIRKLIRAKWKGQFTED